MPVYNAEEFLRSAIDSILQQTYTNFEFIIINDGSSDSSLSIIKEYEIKDSRIKVISRENKGLIFTLNQAISLSKGKYLARMDADDISCPTRFYDQINLLESLKADICGSHYYLINETNKITDFQLSPLDNQSLILYLLRSVPFAHGSAMIRNEFLVKNNLKYGMNVKYAEDKDLWISMFEAGAKFCNVNKPLFYYRELNTSLSKVGYQRCFQDHKLLSAALLDRHFKSFFKKIDLLFDGRHLLTKKEIIYLTELLIIFSLRYLKFNCLKKAFFINKLFFISSICKFFSGRL
jgi:glycosyltransferase involved in cell wall biosynthesis